MSAAGIIPDAALGGVTVTAIPAPSGVTNAYVPPSGFTVSSPLKFYGGDYAATRFDPQQLNAFESEMLALAVAMFPTGTWNTGNVTNLANAFANFQSHWAGGTGGSGPALSNAATYPANIADDVTATTPAFVGAAISAAITIAETATLSVAESSAAANTTTQIAAALIVAEAYTDASLVSHGLVPLARAADYPVDIANDDMSATPAFIQQMINAGITTAETFATTAVATALTTAESVATTAIATSLSTAETYTNTAVAAEATARGTAISSATSAAETFATSADTTVLSTAEAYTDAAVAGLTGGGGGVTSAIAAALTTAEAYTDTQVATAITTAESVAEAAAASAASSAIATALATAETYTDTSATSVTMAAQVFATLSVAAEATARGTAITAAITTAETFATAADTTVLSTAETFATSAVAAEATARGAAISALTSASWNLAALGDTSIITGSGVDGYVIYWNNSAAKFELKVVSASSSIAGATDVTLSSPANYDFLAYDTSSSKWKNTTLSASLDAVFGNTQGSVLYRGASLWTALAPGIAGQVLTSGGAGANPAFANAGGAGGTAPVVVQFGENSAATTLASVVMGVAPTNGNILVSFVWSETALSAASGWTLVSQQTSGFWYLYMYTKTAGASESTSQSPVTGATTNPWTIGIYEISGQSVTPYLMTYSQYLAQSNYSTGLSIPSRSGTLMVFGAACSNQPSTFPNVWGCHTINANLTSSGGARAVFGWSDSSMSRLEFFATTSTNTYVDLGMFLITS